MRVLRREPEEPGLDFLSPYLLHEVRRGDGNEGQKVHAVREEDGRHHEQLGEGSEETEIAVRGDAEDG